MRPFPISPAVEQEIPLVASVLGRPAGSVFVGREREVDELRVGLEEAGAGHGRLVLLVGEPGIGKTRTVHEFAAYARQRNAKVLFGSCYEEEGAPPFWPWVQILRAYVSDQDPEMLKAAMGPGAASIAQVIAEVRERLPGLVPPPPLEPEQARFRFFDSLTTFLKNVGGRQLLVLILDDLQWADKPSLLLLQFLVREIGNVCLLVVGTYRDIALERQHPLSQTLGALVREPNSQRLFLRGFTNEEVAHFVEISTGILPSEALIAALSKETEGNPFFLTEVVHLLVSEGPRSALRTRFSPSSGGA
jgi:predicted ATPase